MHPDHDDEERSAVIADTDIRQVRTMTTSIAGLAAADVAAGVTILTGGVAAAALAAAVAGGLAAGLAAGVGRRASQGEKDFLQEQDRPRRYHSLGQNAR